MSIITSLNTSARLSRRQWQDLQTCNALLRSELGLTPEGHPKFQWVWTGDLRHPMRLVDYRGRLVYRLACECCRDIKNAAAYIHKEGCSGLLTKEPVWEFRLIAGQYWPDPNNKREKIWVGLYAPDGAPAFNRWVLGFWRPPPSEADCKENFPNFNYEFYRNGTYEVVQVNRFALALEENSTPRVATTNKVIEMLKDPTLRKETQTHEEFVTRDERYEQKKKQVIVDELVDKFAMGSIPGKKDSGVEFFGGSAATRSWDAGVPAGASALASEFQVVDRRTSTRLEKES